jgi:hypothetical protein
MMDMKYLNLVCYWDVSLTLTVFTHGIDNPNTTQTLEYTKDKYNAKIIK